MIDPVPSLRDRVRGLLGDAVTLYAGSPWEQRLEAARDRLDGPLVVAVAGRVKAGKSTLLNALVGRAVAATDAGECTRVVTWYRQGDQLRAWGERDGRAVPVSVGVDADDRIVLVPAGYPSSGSLEELESIHVEVPGPALADLVLIDTPGVLSLSEQVAERTRRLVSAAAEDGDSPDAVVYLMRQLHSGDVDFLEAFRDPLGRALAPVNAVGVLSHADEVGGGRPDALSVARRVAHEYSTDPRMRPMVQTVVAVSGLLAEASAVLTADDLRRLRALAAAPAAVVAPLLLSATRFGAPRAGLPVDEDGRRRLLDRLGLFGVRWALDVLRREPWLADEALRSLFEHVSGLSDLRHVLTAQLLGRRDVLKVDAALHLVQRAVADQPRPGSRRLAGLAEKMRIGVHAFEEIRLLNDLRLGLVDLGDRERQRAERLLGSRGGQVHERLGMPGTTGPEELRRAVMAEHGRWDEVAADPLSPPELCRAAAVLQRTCLELLSSP